MPGCARFAQAEQRDWDDHTGRHAQGSPCTDPRSRHPHLPLLLTRSPQFLRTRSLTISRTTHAALICSPCTQKLFRVKAGTVFNGVRFSRLIVLNELLQRSLMGEILSVSLESLAQRRQSLRDSQRSGK